MRVWLALGVTFTGTTLARAALDWAPAQPLNINAATDGEMGDYYPDLATDGQGNWVCVWCAAIPGAIDRDFDVYVSRSDDDGMTWSEPKRLDPFATEPSEIEDDFHPLIETDGAGTWIATWYTHDDHGATIGDDIDILVSTSTDNGETWSASIPLNADAAYDQLPDNYAYDSYPRLAHDGNGHWVAIWQRRLVSGVESDLLIAHSTDGGASWTLPELLHSDMETDDGDDWAPHVAHDGVDQWVLVWSSENTMAGTIGADDDILVSRSSDGYSWSAPEVLNSTATEDGELVDKAPVLETDGAGRWVTIWYQGIYDEIDDDVVFSRSDDHGVTWTPVAYVNDNATTDSARDRRPSVETNGMGHWVVMYYSRNTLGLPIGVDDDIHYVQSTDNAATWTSPGVVNSFAFDVFDNVYDWNPIVGTNGRGRWITVWYSKYDLEGIGPDWDLMVTTADVPPVAGDHDYDADTDMRDWAVFQRCFGQQPLAGVCGLSDLDGSDDVEYVDFTLLAASTSGPG